MARKLALVDPDMLRTAPQIPEYKHKDPRLQEMGILDRNIWKTLTRTDMADDEKAKLYSSSLETFLHHKPDSYMPYRITQHRKKLEEEEEEEADSISGEEIVSTVPKKFRHPAEILLSFLKRTGATWDQKGRLVIKGNTHKDTNIIDLVNDAVRERKPIGRDWNVFTQYLAQHHAPREVVRNKTYWKNITGEGNKKAEKEEEEEEEKFAESFSEQKWLRP